MNCYQQNCKRFHLQSPSVNETDMFALAHKVIISLIGSPVKRPSVPVAPGRQSISPTASSDAAAWSLPPCAPRPGQMLAKAPIGIEPRPRSPVRQRLPAGLPAWMSSRCADSSAIAFPGALANSLGPLMPSSRPVAPAVGMGAKARLIVILGTMPTKGVCIQCGLGGQPRVNKNQ